MFMAPGISDPGVTAGRGLPGLRTQDLTRKEESDPSAGAGHVEEVTCGAPVIAVMIARFARFARYLPRLGHPFIVAKLVPISLIS